MARSLGELGQKKERHADTFTWFGQEIRIGNVSDLVLIDFMQKAQGVNEKDIEAGLALVHQAFGQMIHPDDFDEFWAISLREQQDSTDLMQLMQTLIEGVTGRPTKRRSDSSAGRRKGGKKSKRGSSSPDMPPVVRRLERQGRPELALMVQDRLRSTG